MLSIIGRCENTEMGTLRKYIAINDVKRDLNVLMNISTLTLC